MLRYANQAWQILVVCQAFIFGDLYAAHAKKRALRRRKNGHRSVPMPISTLERLCH